jgi:tetratricopeptide (TPR) repeat protein
MKLIIAFCVLLAALADDYKVYFNKGLADYNREDYTAAVDNFSKSYALKKHSKTSYYIAISYFKLGNDSLAEKFAGRAQAELPALPDEPYQQNIKRIYEFGQLALRFKKIRIIIQQSEKTLTAKQKEENRKIEQELRLYYPDTPEGNARIQDDFMAVQDRSLAGEGELRLDTKNMQFVRDPVVDSLQD